MVLILDMKCFSAPTQQAWRKKASPGLAGVKTAWPVPHVPPGHERCIQGFFFPLSLSLSFFLSPSLCIDEYMNMHLSIHHTSVFYICSLQVVPDEPDTSDESDED